jgi:hypothetical protein
MVHCVGGAWKVLSTVLLSGNGWSSADHQGWCGEGVSGWDILTLLSDWMALAVGGWHACCEPSTKKFAFVLLRAKKSPAKTYMSCTQDKQRSKQHAF